MTVEPILLVGEVVIDVIRLGSEGTSIRPGGICHACRALAAAGARFHVAFAAPSYISEELDAFFTSHGAEGSSWIAETVGAPAVMMVGHPEEATHQGYDWLLRDQMRFRVSQEGLDELAQTRCADVLLIAGDLPLAGVLASLGRSQARVHVDWANAPGPIQEMAALGRPATTFILSTSSPHFLSTYGGQFPALFSAAVPSLADAVILKENRGGSRYQRSNSPPIAVGAQIRPVRHSVGVGDCFDAIFVASAQAEDTGTALRKAAWCAAEYAATFNMNRFEMDVRRALALSQHDLSLSPGIRLPWEDRATMSVYIAAPDFAGRDVANIDAVEGALKYHNFRPRRPVQEIGQLPDGATEADRATVCDADLAIIESSSALVGVYDGDDPGTLVEVGFAAGRGIPTLLFDPSHRARNPMLTGIVNRVTHTLDELILEIFRILGTRLA